MAEPRLNHTPEDEDEPRSSDAPDDSWRSSYRQVMAIGEFRSLWLAHALSTIGSNLLNIAAVTLVFQQTDSPLAAGFTLALTFLPPLIAGPLLSGVADIFPRRRVMVACDLLRASLIFAIGIPGVPLWAIWALLFFSVLPTLPFAAARAALLTEIVQGERYVAGLAIFQLTAQVGTLAGLAAGGYMAAMLGVNMAFMANGAVIVLAALIVLFGVRSRPSPRAEAADRPRLLTMIRDGSKLVFGDHRLRTLALLAWLAGLYMIPYGLASPLSEQVGGGPTSAGLIMAGPFIGAFFGGFVLTRLIPPPTRIRMLGPLAVLASVPLLLWLFDLPLWVMIVALAVSGACSSYQIVANAAFVLCVPKEGRGLAFGLVAAGLQTAQGLGILIAGLLAESFSPNVVVVCAGAVGIVLAAGLALPWTRLAGHTVELMNETEKTS